METQAVDWCLEAAAEEESAQQQGEGAVVGELKVELPGDASTGGLPTTLLCPLRMGENRVGAYASGLEGVDWSDFRGGGAGRSRRGGLNNWSIGRRSAAKSTRRQQQSEGLLTP